MSYTILFLCNLLIPIIMIAGGIYLIKKPPEKINALLGYRTVMSSKNPETWKFAQNYCGRLWVKLGIILLIISIVIQLPFNSSNDDVLNIMTIVIELIQTAVMVISIIPVEKALKNTFDENGNRRL